MEVYMKKVGGQPKHGMRTANNTHPAYRAWHNMKGRCLNPKDKRYKDYGGRGIKVCDRWLDYFIHFRDDMLATWKPGLSLDRIDNDGNYEPNNCKWSTSSEQAKNRRLRERNIKGQFT